jgi:hypothetical protein
MLGNSDSPAVISTHHRDGRRALEKCDSWSRGRAEIGDGNEGLHGIGRSDETS